MTDIEIAASRRAVVACATAQGCELAALFIDEIDTTPEQLHEVLTAVMELDDRILIVPNLLHFAGSGNPIELRQRLRDHQIQVLLSEAPKPVGRVC